MPRGLATLVFAAGILALFRLDRANKLMASPALWLPTIWVLILGSRMVSEWLQIGLTTKSPDQYLDGSPLDRLILTVLMAAGLVVLLARSRRSAAFLNANGTLVLFFLYCGVSVLWSDYPGVAFKRWMKGLGDIVMVLVILTDPDPRAAVKQVLARAAFLLVPLSVLFVKYYPELGRSYDPWTWVPYYGGVAVGKNNLGYVCLVLGIGSLWRWLAAFQAERMHRVGPLIAHGAILAMVFWLLFKANSATSLASFLVVGGLLVLITLSASTRPGSPAQVFLVAVFLLSLSGWFLSFGLNVVEAMGRDTTMTGRTELWRELLRIRADPLLGTGFESFWLGERAEKFWRVYWWHPNQAHNGYLEIFLNLGWVGVLLLIAVLVRACQNIARTFSRDPELARLRLAFVTIAVLYNMTEAAFKSFHLVGFAFLLAAVAAPTPRHRGDG